MRLSRNLPDRVSPDAYFRYYQHPIDVCAIGKDRVKASHYVENLVGGARFETIDAPETIGPDLISSFRSQALTVELEASEVDERPAKPDRARSVCQS
jgi:hypothetical protein